MSSHITHIGLLQHGAVEAGDVFCGHLETSLTKQGWKNLKQKFSRNAGKWNAVVTSPQTQCVEFAEWFAQKNDLPVMRDERLREINFGVWEGCCPRQLAQMQATDLCNWWSNPAQYTPEQGETLVDFRQRVAEAWTELVYSWRGQRVLVVTHAWVIRVVLALVLCMPDDALSTVNIEYGTLTELRVLRDASGTWTTLLTHGC